MGDSESIKELKKDNTDALVALIDRYGNYVAKILCSFLGSGLTQQDLEEISSDVFFALWQQRHRLLEKESLKAYLATIAKNTGRKRLRRLKTVVPFPDAYEIPTDDLSPEEAIELSEKCQMTLSLISSLGKEDKEIFHRYYYLEQTTGEIAKLMHLNKSTVMSRLARGRATIRMKAGGCAK